MYIKKTINDFIEKYSPRTTIKLVCFIVLGIVVISLLASDLLVPKPTQTEHKPTQIEKIYIPRTQTEAIMEAINKDFNFPDGLLISMARLETGLGTSNIAFNSNNWYNIKCSGKNCGYKGYMKFNDPADSVYYVARLIKEDKRYYAWQLTGLLDDLGKVYAEDKEWAKKINQILCEYN